VNRSVIGLCTLVGSIVGGVVPELFGASALGLTSFGCSVAGAVAGVFLGARLSSL
jgi:uncharacterized protein YcfJ